MSCLLAYASHLRSSTNDSILRKFIPLAVSAVHVFTSSLLKPVRDSSTKGIMQCAGKRLRMLSSCASNLCLLSHTKAALTSNTILCKSWMHRGCLEDDDPSFQYNSFVDVPQDGHMTEPSGNKDGCVRYGFHTIIEGRKESSSMQLLTSGSGGVIMPWKHRPPEQKRYAVN